MNRYTDQLIKLQPPGMALPTSADSDWVRLLSGFSLEYERLDKRLDDLVENVLLQGGNELLAEWERVLGLPDECTKGLEQISDDLRRARIRSKLADTGRADKAYFIELADSLGINATIIESMPFFLGKGRMGDAIGGFDNLLVWQMDFESPISSEQFLMIKCVVRHNKPAETHVIFSIDGVPEDITAGYNYHEMRIETWAGELHTLPDDRLICDGSKLSSVIYPSLFKWLGYTYSEWDETDPENKDYFRLPDLRGLTILGTTASEEVGEYQEDKVMWHEHKVVTYKSGAFPQNWTIAGSGSNNTTALAMPIGVDTRMKNISVYFTIKIRPFFYDNTIGEVAFTPSPVLPRNALWTNGGEVSRTEYAALFAIIGTTYGAGDGETTFNLPLIDCYVRATALGSVTDPDAATRTNRGDGITGDAVGTRQSGAIGAHSHEILDYVNQTVSVGWIRGFGTKIQIGSPIVSSAAHIGGQALDDVEIVTPSVLPSVVAKQNPSLYSQPFVIKDAFDGKNHMRSLRMPGVIFYA